MGAYFTDETMLNIERDNARKAILNIKKPFCVSDLFIYMEQIGFSNRRIILQLLDELFEDGLIDYVRVDKPTAEFAFIVGDVADRPQGKWIGSKYEDSDWMPLESDFYKCSICGKIVNLLQMHNYNYCPNCGAKMESNR